MGVIQRQSRSNSIIISVAFFLGAIYSVFIVPRVFHEHPEQWGLVNLLLRYAQIVVIPVLVGFPAVIIRYTPLYAKQEKGEGIFTYSFWICTSLFVLFSVIWFFTGDHLLLEENPMYEEYYWVLIPLLLGLYIFELLAAYSRIKQRSVMPFFLNTGLQKILFFLLLVLMYFQLISFSIFFVFFVLLSVVKPLLLWLDLSIAGELPRLSRPSLGSSGIPGLRDYALFNALGTIAFLVITQIDSVMIGNMMGLDQLAYYSIPVFLISAMSVPEKSLTQISLPVISSLFAEKKFREVDVIYKKTAINQLLIGGGIFVFVWINIDFLMDLLGEKFGNTAFVFLLLGVGKIIDLATSVNGSILTISHKYRFVLFLQLTLLLLAIVLNIWFIPLWGMEGAALATMVSMLIYNVLKSVLVYRWYRLQPFNRNVFIVFVMLLISSAFSFLDFTGSQMVSAVIKTGGLAIVWLGLVLFTDVAVDLQVELKRILHFRR